MSETSDPSNTAATGSAADASISTATTSTTTRIASPPSSGNAAVAASAAASASATVTITQQAPPQTQTLNEQVLRLTLQDRIGVQWDDDVVDNEGMGRKSSKRCCIFHKPRAFGESSTDTSDYDSDNENGKYSGHRHKKIAHKKGNKKVPDHLKWHA